MKLDKNPKFERYLEALDYGQLAQLERSMLADLTSEPILWWHNPKSGKDELLDGHNRQVIAIKHKLPVQYHEKHFDNEDDAEHFIIRTQTQRRNLEAYDRNQLLKRAVEIEIGRGKKKTEAVQEVAEQMGVAESTAWEAVKPVNPVEAFKEAKAQFERKITAVKNKAAAKLKAEIVKDGLDEDAATAQWEGVEAGIDEEHKDEVAELEAMAEAAQQAVEDSPGLKNTGKRTTKKSTRDKAARRNTFKKATSLISKLRNEAFYFWEQNGCGDVDIAGADAALKALSVAIGEAQAADAKAAKKRFGR